MNIVRHLTQALKFYGGLSLAGAVGVFVLVEGWRVGGYLLDSLMSTAGLQHRGELTVSLIYLSVSAVYLRTSAHRAFLAANALVQFADALNILAGTGGLYGLLISVGALFPVARQFDTYSVTLITMSILLLATMLFHRRIRS